MSEAKYGYLVGFNNNFNPKIGKGNGNIGDCTFTLTSKEADEKIRNFHPLPRSPEYIKFKLVPVKIRRRNERRKSD